MSSNWKPFLEPCTSDSGQLYHVYMLRFRGVYSPCFQIFVTVQVLITYSMQNQKGEALVYYITRITLNVVPR